MSVNPLEVRQRDSVYRRGVLLGMTMAEILILLLFCLLMAFVLRLDEYKTKLEQSEKVEKLLDELAKTAGSYDDAWKMLSNLQTVVKNLGPDSLNEIASKVVKDSKVTKEDIAGALAVGLEQFSTTKAQLAAKDGKPPAPEAVIEAIQARIAKSEEYVQVAPALDALKAMEAAIKETTGEKPSPEDMETAIQQLQADAEAWRTAENGDLAKKYQESLVQNQDLNERAGRLERALGTATDQLEGKGQGLEYPSCFVNEEGGIQYVFDIEFDESGMTLKSLPVPGNEERWQRLAFDRITTGHAMPVKQYLAETNAVFEWSKANVCRFFVRIFDRTLPENKQQYKTMKRNIESRFYTAEPRQALSERSELPATSI